jgi:hypothetical protein
MVAAIKAARSPGVKDDTKVNSVQSANCRPEIVRGKSSVIERRAKLWPGREAPHTCNAARDSRERVQVDVAIDEQADTRSIIIIVMKRPSRASA